MNPFVPLIAAVDIDTVIKILVLLLVFVVPVIAQLVANMRQAQQQQPGGPLRPPPGGPPDVANEIEKFLRRAAGRRNAKGVRPITIQEPTPADAEPVRAEVVANRPVGSPLSEHVTEYLDAEDFGRRSEKLGEEVAEEVNKEIDQHLHQVFDHRVSQLDAVPDEAAVPPAAYAPPDLVGAAADIPTSFATGLLDLVSNPDSLRQAIAMNEILRRPEERWS